MGWWWSRGEGAEVSDTQYAKDGLPLLGELSGDGLKALAHDLAAEAVLLRGAAGWYDGGDPYVPFGQDGNHSDWESHVLSQWVRLSPEKRGYTQPSDSFYWDDFYRDDTVAEREYGLKVMKTFSSVQALRPGEEGRSLVGSPEAQMKNLLNNAMKVLHPEYWSSGNQHPWRDRFTAELKRLEEYHKPGTMNALGLEFPPEEMPRLIGLTGTLLARVRESATAPGSYRVAEMAMIEIDVLSRIQGATDPSTLFEALRQLVVPVEARTQQVFGQAQSQGAQSEHVAGTLAGPITAPSAPKQVAPAGSGAVANSNGGQDVPVGTRRAPTASATRVVQGKKG